MSSLLTSPSGQSSTASQLRVTQACEAGLKFAELFYQKLDKSRHTMGSLFHDNATVIWNGNVVRGKANVMPFYEALPTVETDLLSIDAHPVLEAAAGYQTMICVLCSGKMRFSSSQTKSFTESFMLTAENNIWKIVSDTYRTY